jgi:hypothetical protein
MRWSTANISINFREGAMENSKIQLRMFQTNGLRIRIIIRKFLFCLAIALLACPNCSQQKKGSEPMVKKNNKPTFPLDKEGWLDKDNFQVIESVQSLNPAGNKEIENKIENKAFFRAAQLILFSRYRIFKDDMAIVAKLAKFSPYSGLMHGKVIKIELAADKARVVYRISGQNLKRSLKGVLNSFEEANPSLRKIIKDDDFSF